MENSLHLQFLRTTEEVRSLEIWNWLKTGTKKKETEGMLVFA